MMYTRRQSEEGLGEVEEVVRRFFENPQIEEGYL